MFWHNLFEALSRKKYDYNDDDEDELVSNSTTPVNTPATEGKEGEGDVKLARVLGLTDLTMLGVGATLGVGVYVLAGSVARKQAGPSVIISFMIAAIASLFSGLCYSEFASRISKSGSAYNYTYLSIGEFAAYIIGWNLVLEYVIGTASEAKAISNQIDSLLSNSYQNLMTDLFPIHSAFLSTYPDIIAPIFVFVITGLLSWGVKESAKINNFFTFVNLITVGVIVFTGLFKINLKNWYIKKEDIPPTVSNAGKGGFMPFGINGIIVGAAKCFFGFVGFDGISTTGEETKNPKRNIPLSIVLSLFIVFVCYFSIAVVLTLIIPYYEEDPEAPFPHIFDKMGWPIMKWVVTTGSLFALFTAMFGAFFPLPRILYAMSKDGLLYKRFSYVSPFTKTPLISTFLSGIITAIMSAIFKLDQLVDMMSIGTLLAYIIVAVCVLLLRYSDEELTRQNEIVLRGAVNEFDFDVNIQTVGNEYKQMDNQKQLILSGKQNVDANYEHGGLKINTISDCRETSTENNSSQCNDSDNNHRPAANGLTDTSGKTNGHFGNNLKLHANTVNSGTISNEHKTNENDIVYKINATSDVNGLNHVNTFRTKPSSKLRQVFVRLFNLNNSKVVTGSSQTISKTCIYILITLTILSSFVLNNITSQSKGLDELETFKMYDVQFKVYNNFNSSFDVPGLDAQNNYTTDSTRHKHDLQTLCEFMSEHVTNNKVVTNFKAFTNMDDDAIQMFKYVCYTLIGVAYVVTYVILARQGQNKSRLKFKVPLVPLIPCVSIFMNIYLMINLDISTWIRFVIWLVLGMFIYFSYSISHSKQKKY